MKEIIVKRIKQPVGMMPFQIIIGDTPPVSIQNGETIKVIVKEIPAKLVVKQGWLKSKTIMIDDAVHEISVSNNLVKNRIVPGIGGLLVALMILPKYLINNTQLAKTVTTICICLILFWAIYFLLIKRDDWIFIAIDQKRNNMYP